MARIGKQDLTNTKDHCPVAKVALSKPNELPNLQRLSQPAYTRILPIYIYRKAKNTAIYYGE